MKNLSIFGKFTFLLLFVWPPIGGAILVVGMQKFYILFLIGLFMVNGSLAQGWQWQNPLPQGNTLNCVKFVDTNKGYAVGYCGAILITADGGVNWTSQNAGTMAVLQSVSFPDANTGHAVGLNGWMVQVGKIVKY